ADCDHRSAEYQVERERLEAALAAEVDRSAVDRELARAELDRLAAEQRGVIAELDRLRAELAERDAALALGEVRHQAARCDWLRESSEAEAREANRREADRREAEAQRAALTAACEARLRDERSRAESECLRALAELEAASQQFVAERCAFDAE